jgi:chromosome segregation ATPase
MSGDWLTLMKGKVMEDTLKSIQNSLAMIQTKVDRIDSIETKVDRIDSIETKVDRMEVGLSSLDEDVRKIDGRVQEELKRIKESISALEGDIQEIKQGNELRRFATEFKQHSEPQLAERAPGEYNRRMFSGRLRRNSLSYYNQG